MWGLAPGWWPLGVLFRLVGSLHCNCTFLSAILILLVEFGTTQNIAFDKEASQSKFLLGALHGFQPLPSNEINRAVYECFIRRHVDTVFGPEGIATLTIRHIEAFRGSPLSSAASTVVTSETLAAISHVLNSCSVDVAEGGVEEALLLDAALAVHPLNAFAAKNFAIRFEYGGYYEVAADLFAGCAALTGDKGCLLHSIFTAPLLFWTEEEAWKSHLSMLIGAQNVLATPQLPFTPYSDTALRALQLNVFYSGHSPGVTAQVYTHILRHLFPANLEVNMVYPARQARHKVRRMGIVSEHERNSSPGLCLTSVLAKLAQNQPYSDDNLEHTFELVFFVRPSSRTVFSAKMREVAKEVIILDPDKGVDAARHLIAEQDLDILLYIALPTEKFTTLLSMSRLATIQLHFGIGHPYSSGSGSIDYSIVSSTMFATLRSVSQARAITASMCIDLLRNCLNESDNNLLLDSSKYRAAPACGSLLEFGCSAAPFNLERHCNNNFAGSYSEQLVLFDSLGYFLDDPLTMYPETFDPIAMAFASPCQALDKMLHAWGLFPNMTSHDVGCISENGNLLPRRSNIYVCIQIPKKMHPTFDRVLASILASDKAAKILLHYGTRSLLPRWEQSLGLHSDELHRKLVFVPRLAHDEYLKLVALSAVFLNTFPFGAGITSSEALGLCVPVVTLPAASSVLSLTLGQLRALGPYVAELCVVNSLDEYITKALEIATLSAEALRALRQEVCRDRDHLFGENVLESVVEEWREFLKNL